MLALCFSTAPTVSTRDEAIAAFDRPSAMSSSTSRSRGVSAPPGRARCRRRRRAGPRRRSRRRRGRGPSADSRRPPLPPRRGARSRTCARRTARRRGSPSPAAAPRRYRAAPPPRARAHLRDRRRTSAPRARGSCRARRAAPVLRRAGLVRCGAARNPDSCVFWSTPYAAERRSPSRRGRTVQHVVGFHQCVRTRGSQRSHRKMSIREVAFGAHATSIRGRRGRPLRD